MALMAGLTLNTFAALYTYDWTGINAAIPDGDPNGYVNNQTITDGYQMNDMFPPNQYIVSVVGVRLDVSGGWNGDLYVYLRHETESGTGFTTLLNRVGTTASPYNPIGYTTAGMNITLSDSASYADIHGVENPTASGTYRVDQTGSSLTFDSFDGLDPYGTWSLFVADLSGNHVSTLNGWGLTLEAVPEPSTWGMIIFGTLFVGGQFIQWRRRPVLAKSRSRILARRSDLDW